MQITMPIEQFLHYRFDNNVVNNMMDVIEYKPTSCMGDLYWICAVQEVVKSVLPLVKGEDWDKLLKNISECIKAIRAYDPTYMGTHTRTRWAMFVAEYENWEVQ